MDKEYARLKAFFGKDDEQRIENLHMFAQLIRLQREQRSTEDGVHHEPF